MGVGHYVVVDFVADDEREVVGVKVLRCAVSRHERLCESCDFWMVRLRCW